MNETDYPDPERKRLAAIELANSYREMMAMFGWKHLKGNVMARIRAESNDDVDNLAIDALTVAHVAEARGIRKCLEKIDAEINWILNGNEPITRNTGG